MGTTATIRSGAQLTALKKLYADLGWNEKRQKGMNLRVIKKDTPLTDKDAQKVYQALDRYLMHRVQPHYIAFTQLVYAMESEGHLLTEWERGFVADVSRRIRSSMKVTVKMVKKIREIAHVRDFELTFPNFREISEAADAQRREKRR